VPAPRQLSLLARVTHSAQPRSFPHPSNGLGIRVSFSHISPVPNFTVRTTAAGIGISSPVHSRLCPRPQNAHDRETSSGAFHAQLQGVLGLSPIHDDTDSAAWLGWIYDLGVPLPARISTILSARTRVGKFRSKLQPIIRLFHRRDPAPHRHAHPSRHAGASANSPRSCLHSRTGPDIFRSLTECVHFNPKVFCCRGATVATRLAGRAVSSHRPALEGPSTSTRFLIPIIVGGAVPTVPPLGCLLLPNPR